MSKWRVVFDGEIEDKMFDSKEDADDYLSDILGADPVGIETLS